MSCPSPYNNHDAIVVAIGTCCSDRYVVSNDYRDFEPTVRKTIRKVLGVMIVDSAEHVA